LCGGPGDECVNNAKKIAIVPFWGFVRSRGTATVPQTAPWGVLGGHVAGTATDVADTGRCGGPTRTRRGTKGASGAPGRHTDRGLRVQPPWPSGGLTSTYREPSATRD